MEHIPEFGVFLIGGPKERGSNTTATTCALKGGEMFVDRLTVQRGELLVATTKKVNGRKHIKHGTSSQYWFVFDMRDLSQRTQAGNCSETN